MFDETLKLMKAKLGPDRLGTLKCMNNLAVAYLEAGKLELVLPLWEDTLMLQKAKLGTDHPSTLNSMSHLADAYLKAGKFILTVPLWEEALKLTKAKLGPGDPTTLHSMSDLADADLDAGKLDLALSLLAEQSSLSPEDTVLTMKVAALAAWFSESEEFAANTERALRFAKDTQDPVIAERTAKTCCLSPSDDKAHLAAALQLARLAVEQGKDHIYLRYFQMALGMAEYRSGNFPAAENTLFTATKGIKGPDFLVRTSGIYRAMSLFHQGKAAEARELVLATAANMKPLPKNNDNNPMAEQG